MLTSKSFFSAILQMSLILHSCVVNGQLPTEVSFRKEINQYGITWTFDKPMQTGKFITGDWWVVGPVKIIKVTPQPGPVRTDTMTFKPNRWNDTSLKNDTTLRNGSMIVSKAGHKQSYDSRAAAFSKEEVIVFPILLNPSSSLISSISICNCPLIILRRISCGSRKQSQKRL